MKQFKKMSVFLFAKLFYLLLFLLMCGTLCGQVCATVETPSSDSGRTIQLFQEKEKESVTSTPERGKAKEVNVKDYYSPVFVKCGNVVVALAGVNRENKIGKHNTVLTKRIDIKNENSWGDEVIAKTGDKWKTQFAVYDECQDSGCDGDSDSTAIRTLGTTVKQDRIYIFLANFSTKEQTLESCTESKSCFWLVVGDTTQKKTGQPIVWEEKRLKVSDTEQFNEIKKKDLSDPHLCVSSAFLIEEKNFLFIVKSQLKEGLHNKNNEKNVTVFFLYDENDQNNLKLLDVESTEGLHPTFFEWDGKIFKTPTDDKSERSKNIMEFIVNGKKFEDTNNSIASLQTFLKDKKYFVNATIQGKGTVLLFTQQNYGASQNEVYLWMYDSTRISKVGTMIKNTKENFYGSLLYTGNELFVLYQTYEKDAEQDSKKIYLTRLKEELENIKNILDAWKHNDDNIKEGCKDINEESSFCSFPLPTNGLVGFLSSTVVKGAVTTWKDEYYYTNATVNNGNKSENGLQFSGAGAGAQWLEGEQLANQPYKFTDPGFTLLATLTIDKTNKQVDNSLLGLIFHKQAKRIGLWCSNEKWAVNTEENKMKYSTLECKHEKPYIVTFVLNDGTFFVYVDGDKLTGLNEELKFQIDKTDTIDNFYFGADIGAQNLQSTESYVTATNAFLYKRPFIDTEIKQLKEYVKTIEDTTNTKESKNNTKSNNDQPTSTPLPSTTNNEKASSPSRTEDGGVGGGVRVFSLMLAVFCVSAPLLHL